MMSFSCYDAKLLMHLIRLKNTSPLLDIFSLGTFVWDHSGIRITGMMRLCVCLGAILIPESLDFHSGYSAPGSRIAGRAIIMTSLFSLETKMASCSDESVEAVERRKGFWWNREDTLLLISQYREHEKLFRDINCKNTSAWELITASMVAENPNFSARRDQSRLRESGNH